MIAGRYRQPRQMASHHSDLIATEVDHLLKYAPGKVTCPVRNSIQFSYVVRIQRMRFGNSTFMSTKGGLQTFAAGTFLSKHRPKEDIWLWMEPKDTAIKP